MAKAALSIAMARIHHEMKDHFVMFSRNGRWGTCASCPMDSNGMKYPEFCDYTKRSDHQLDVKELAEQHLIRLKNS